MSTRVALFSDAIRTSLRLYARGLALPFAALLARPAPGFEKP